MLSQVARPLGGVHLIDDVGVALKPRHAQPPALEVPNTDLLEVARIKANSRLEMRSFALDQTEVLTQVDALIPDLVEDDPIPVDFRLNNQAETKAKIFIVDLQRSTHPAAKPTPHVQGRGVVQSPVPLVVVVVDDPDEEALAHLVEREHGVLLRLV